MLLKSLVATLVLWAFIHFRVAMSEALNVNWLTNSDLVPQNWSRDLGGKLTIRLRNNFLRRDKHIPDSDFITQFGKGMKGGTCPWKTGIIPYRISRLFDREDQHVLRNLLMNLSSSCVGVNPWGNETDYLYFSPCSRCYTRCGLQETKQTIALAGGCLQSTKDLQNAIIQALGYLLATHWMKQKTQPLQSFSRVRSKRDDSFEPPLETDSISLEECRALDSANCNLSSVSQNCLSKHFHIDCSEYSTNSEISSVMTKIGLLNKDWPVSVSLAGDRNLSSKLFSPLNKNIIALQVRNNSALTMTQFRNCSLPSLQELEILNGQYLELSKQDFENLSMLQKLSFSRFSISRIEEGSFDNLGKLEILSLEGGFHPSLSGATVQQLYSIWKLHCDCSYAWLRQLFRERPNLLRNTITGLEDQQNASASKYFGFVPVDCDADNLMNSENQTIFSVHSGCSDADLGTNSTKSDVLMGKDHAANASRTSGKQIKTQAIGKGKGSLQGADRDIPSTTLPLVHVMNYKFPFFYARAISLDECLKLDTKNCILSQNSKNCTSKYFYVICSKNATESEITFSMENIRSLHRERSVALEINGPSLTFQLFSPVADSLRSLNIIGNNQFAMTQLRYLKTPKLLSLTLTKVHNLEVTKNDLDAFPNLRILKFDQCTFLSIEESSFDGLPSLKLLSFGKWSGNVSAFALSPLRSVQLYKLHCDCDFAWLREFYEGRPYLLKRRITGEIYNSYDFRNRHFDLNDIFIPVDCTNPMLIGSVNQSQFSVNDNCCGYTSMDRNRELQLVAQSCFYSKNQVFQDPVLEINPDRNSQLETLKYLNEWIVYPIFLIVCTVGNALTLLVLAYERQKGSATAYLMTIAIADLCSMWVCLPVVLYSVLHGPNRSPALILAYDEYFGLNIFILGTMRQLSNWALVIFSVERFLAIVRPLRFRGMQSFRSAWITCGILTVLCGAMKLYYIVLYYTYTYPLMDRKDTKLSSWLATWTDVQNQSEVGLTLLNFFVLLMMNVMIVCAIRRVIKSHKSGTLKTTNTSTANTNAKSQFKNSNRLLLGSVGLFLSMQFPWVVYGCILVGDSTASVVPPNKRDLVAEIARGFLFVNYSCNCYVYLFVSKHFRKQLATIFSGYWSSIHRGTVKALPSVTKNQARRQSSKPLHSDIETSVV